MLGFVSLALLPSLLSTLIQTLIIIIVVIDNGNARRRRRRIHASEPPAGYEVSKPTDIELIRYYLRRWRIMSSSSSSSSVAAPTCLIQEFDVYVTEPWNLPCDAFQYQSEEKLQMYFFTPRHRTSTSSHRVKRTAGRGYWRGNGEKPIWDGHRVIGYRTQLTFTLLNGKDNSKTDQWIMHEYCLHSASNTREFEDMVLCRIYKKKNKKSDGDTAAAAAAGTSSAVVLWEEPEEGMLLNLQEAYIESSASFLPDMSAFDRSWEDLGGLVPVADGVAVSVVVAGEQEAAAETDDRLLKRKLVEEPEQQQQCLMADNTESTMRSLPPPDAEFHTSSSSLAVGEQAAAETEETLLKRRRVEEPEQQQQQGLMANNNTESTRQPTSFDDDFLVEYLVCVDGLGSSPLPLL